MKKVICHDLDGNNFEIDASKLSFRPSVYGVLLDGEKVLLSKQWGGYDFPGGGMHIHETIEEALKREFFEETGIKIRLVAPAYCATSFFNPSYSEKNKHKYWNCPLIYFLVEKVGGEISKDYLDEEEQKYADLPEWIDINEFSKLKFYNSVDNIKVAKEALKIKK